MGEISRYGVERASKEFCTIAETLKEAVLELEKLYAMTGKLDNPTHMKLTDMRKRIEQVIADVC